MIHGEPITPTDPTTRKRDHFMDPWTLQRITALKKELEDQRPARKAPMSKFKSDRDLEDDVLFLSLMNRALLEILIKKGICTKAQLVTEMRQLDLLDGEEDGGLNTEVLADDLGVQRPDKHSP